jgi:hypothetical protein
MSINTISLNPEALDVHITTLQDYTNELTELATAVSALIFGSAGNTSAGPCSGRANELNTAIHDIAVATAAVLEQSVVHLNNIKNDIVTADGTNG